MELTAKDVAEMEKLLRAHEIFYFEVGLGLRKIWAPLGDGWTVRASDRHSVLSATCARDIEHIKNAGVLMALDEDVSDKIFVLLRCAIYDKYHITIRARDGVLMDGVYFGRNHAAIAIQKMLRVHRPVEYKSERERDGKLSAVGRSVNLSASGTML